MLVERERESEWILWAVRLLAFLWPFLFVSLVMVPAIDLVLDFCDFFFFFFQEKFRTELLYFDNMLEPLFFF